MTDAEAYRLYRQATGVPWWRFWLTDWEKREARLLARGVQMVRMNEAITKTRAMQ